MEFVYREIRNFAACCLVVFYFTKFVICDIMLPVRLGVFMFQPLKALWDNWDKMPLRERVARMIVFQDAPKGINVVTKKYIDQNYQDCLTAADAILFEFCGKSYSSAKLFEELDFRMASRPATGLVRVAVNPRNFYVKDLGFLAELFKELKDKIPFAFDIVDGPTVEVLGGRRLAGVVSVEMQITFFISDEEADERLQVAGFSQGFELTK